MTMTVASSHLAFHESDEHQRRLVSHRLTRYAVPIGRALFSLIFLLAAPAHLRAATIEYARSQGVPMANVLVPASGALALLGAMSIALGFKARYGAFMLVVFLVPVTLMMHKFWVIADAQQAAMQQVMFMKNMSLLGCALILTHFGAGPLSIDAMLFKSKNDASLGRVSAAER